MTYSFISNIIDDNMACSGRKEENVAVSKSFREQKLESYWQITKGWLDNITSGISSADIIKSYGANEIALYGIGILATYLIRELEKSDIVIKYGIEASGRDLNDYDFEAIKNKLVKKTDAKIISIKELYDRLKKI